MLLKWAAALEAFLLPYGAWGLLGIAFLDSAFLPLPHAIDLGVLTLSVRDPDSVVMLAAGATLGSVAGCVVLYHIARLGGHAYLEKKVGKARAERIRNWFERYEFLTVMVPAILPPPVPLKPFVITAGVLEVHMGKFLLALFIGRSIRYFGEGFLAVRYGPAAWQFLTRHGRVLGLAMVGAVLAGTLVTRIVARRRGDTAGVKI